MRLQEYLSCVCVALVATRVCVDASSDGWTPIIPESIPERLVDPGVTSILGPSTSYHRPSHLAGRPYRSRTPHLHSPKYSLLQHSDSEHEDTCSLYKAAMTQDLYFQYIQYKVHLPDLKEFTLCMWHKFYNHSSDHPLFSYATRETSRAILSWVSSTDRSTYFSMSVDGHTLYRLNYPLRLNRWYHSCQSWNGRTGEWQVWVNAERVGRGFHNLLVKHVIKGGGVAITGQEQRQYGGGFLEGEGAPKGSGGMLGEVTQLQMYSVALTAGKAYRDHKHHHGNYGTDPQAPPTAATTAAPQPETSTMSPYAPFLTNGQLTPQLPIFELSAYRKNVPMPPTDAPTSGAMLELAPLSSLPAVSYLHMSPSGSGSTPVRIPLITHARPALDLDDIRQQHFVFKREGDAKLREEGAPSPLQETPAEKGAKKRVKRDTSEQGDGRIVKKEPASEDPKPVKRDRESKRLKATERRGAVKRKVLKMDPVTESKLTKRQTISLDGGPVDLGDGDIDTSLLTRGLSHTGASSYLSSFSQSGSGSPLMSYVEFHGNNQQLLSEPLANSDVKEPPPLKKETEPAEGEVMAVMAMCSGCSPDPFAKVNIISWQGTPKKLYSGVLYLPAKPVCRKF